jgi:tetratricopeptide (TPR) repeat protein
MMSRLTLLSVCLVFLFCGCSQRNIQTVDSRVYSSDGSHEAPALTDTVTLAEEVAAHLAMPDTNQAEIRALAEAALADYRDFEVEVKHSYDAIYRRWYEAGNIRKRVHRGVGLGNSLIALGKATATDPSFVEAWTAQGRLACEAGDVHQGLEYLDNARTAARVRQQADRPVDDATLLELYRQRAWALRDLARWEEGLAAVTEGLKFKPGDRDLVLIKGLLLAGAGRYSEAVSLAVRMPPMRYPKYTLLNEGLEYQESAYANLWIKSQALLAIGDYEMAFRIFGDMELYPYRGMLVHADRFWEDVGLVAELVGDEDAPVYYAIGYIMRKYDRYYPVGAHNMTPLVLDVPNERMPCYTSFGQRFYVAGSYFSYIAGQMNMMSLGIFDDQKLQAAGRALLALEIAERRNIRPDVCRALRGRILYYGDDFVGAYQELKAAREGFREQGQVDSGTSLLLGMIELQASRHQAAARYFEEAVAKDPALAVGWRSLGIVYANLGLLDKAEEAMTTALSLQPRSVSGLYNRGLFYYQTQKYDRSLVDLDQALKLEPENREVQRMLQMAASSYRAEGGNPSAYLASSSAALIPAEGGEPGITFETDPEALLAQLETDITGFFTRPDSLARTPAEIDQTIADLEARYFDNGDRGVRKILALAYIDQERFRRAQEILTPGWGVDLEPDEEIMLLYTDRMLGEQKRAQELAQAMVAGEAGTDNPYVWAITAMVMRDDPRAVDSSLVNTMFMNKMSYGLAKEATTSVFGWSTFMRSGFSNLRAASTHDRDVVLPIPDEQQPFFRGLGAVSGGVSGTAGGKDGSVK